MPFVRRRPQTMSASGAPETTVKTTPSSGSTDPGYSLKHVLASGSGRRRSGWLGGLGPPRTDEQRCAGADEYGKAADQDDQTQAADERDVGGVGESGVPRR